MQYITPSILFALAVLLAAILFLCRYAAASQRSPLDPGWVTGSGKKLSFAGKRHPMEKNDCLPILLITFLYALSAFFSLGNLSAPQETYDFGGGQSLLIRVDGKALSVNGFRYYSGLGTGAYDIQVSPDGETWLTLREAGEDRWEFAETGSHAYALPQKYNQLYKWLDVTFETQTVQHLRITGRADKEVLELSRLCLLDGYAQPIQFGWSSAEEENYAGLFLADELVPEQGHWMNSTYFDEIYHARTAKEHIDNVYPYEVTHPPLGKLIMGLGIRAFGMTPFGWRFMGTLLGVLMLPILYIFLKNLFGKTVVSVCGTTLFAADFMHLTHTRIATIDTYAVFFILLMYFFMYRYLTLPAGSSFGDGAPDLFLSGLFWGLGAASKWTVFYAGIGLALLYFIGFYQKMRDWPREGGVRRGPWVTGTLLFSVLCFVLIPFVIYCAAYIPYAIARGIEFFPAIGDDGAYPNLLVRVGAAFKSGFTPFFENLRDKLTGAAAAEGYRAATIPQNSLPGIVANNQWYMLTYHQGVHQPHPYASWWFQWIVDGRPILYYMDNVYNTAGALTHTTRFAAFANPVLCWTGLGAILICGAAAFRRVWAKGLFLVGLGAFAAAVTYKVQQTENGVFDPALAPEELKRNMLILIACVLLYLAVCCLILTFVKGHSGKAAFILVGFLSQLIPWMFIGRTTFEYHYFPSLLFLVLAVSYLLDGLVEWDRAWEGPVYGLTGLSVGLYVLFYPVLIGLQIPRWYESLVAWIPSWPF